MRSAIIDSIQDYELRNFLTGIFNATAVEIFSDERPRIAIRMLEVLYDIYRGINYLGLPGMSMVYGAGTRMPTGMCRYSLYNIPKTWKRYILRKLIEYGLIRADRDVNMLDPNTRFMLTDKGEKVVEEVERKIRSYIPVYYAPRIDNLIRSIGAIVVNIPDREAREEMVKYIKKRLEEEFGGI